MTPARFAHFLYGSLWVELRGPGVEEVLRALHADGISLYRVRPGVERCTLWLNLRDFTPLYRACRQRKVRMRFLRREGVPFWWRRLRRRKSMVLGALLFCAVVYGCSGFVWRVSVHGVPDDDVPLVLQAAHDTGLFPGAWKGGLPPLTRIQENILEQVPQLVWVGVQVSGARATVDAVAEIPGVDNKPASPHPIVAAKPGVIRKVFANRGEVLVRSGQIVYPGQVLISGDLGGVKQVAAEGQVLAEVWYTSKVRMPLAVTHHEMNGKSVERQYLAVGPLALRVWGWRQPNFQASLERLVESEWHWGDWVLPVQWETSTLYEVSAHTLQRTLAQAQHQALEAAAQDVRGQMAADGTLLGQSVLQQEVKHGNLYETVLTRTEEDIGVPAAQSAPPPGGSGVSP